MLVPAKDWCSGFFPGSLWMLYEATEGNLLLYLLLVTSCRNKLSTRSTHSFDMPSITDLELYRAAQSYTNGLYHQKDNHDTHDIGFILYCSYGNGIRFINTTARSQDKGKIVDGDDSYDTYVQALLDGAQSLASRFNPTVGCIQVNKSIDKATIDTILPARNITFPLFNTTHTILTHDSLNTTLHYTAHQSWPARNGWTFPVIIDNLMNLELLFWAAAHLNTSAATTRRRSRLTTVNEGSLDGGKVRERSLGGRLSGSQLRAIAISHLDKTLLNHFRPDGKILTTMTKIILMDQ